jgi:hypothetical protein
MTDLFEARLTYLRDWWAKHGNTVDFDTADDWINSMTNVELLCTLSWAKHEKPPVDRKVLCAREAIRETPFDTKIKTEVVAIRAIELWEEGFGK